MGSGIVCGQSICFTTLRIWLQSTCTATVAQPCQSLCQRSEISEPRAKVASIGCPLGVEADTETSCQQRAEGTLASMTSPVPPTHPGTDLWANVNSTILQSASVGKFQAELEELSQNVCKSIVVLEHRFQFGSFKASYGGY